MNESKEGVRVQAALDAMIPAQAHGALLLADALAKGAASAHRSSHARAERARKSADDAYNVDPMAPLLEATAIGAAGADMQWASFLKEVRQRAENRLKRLDLPDSPEEEEEGAGGGEGVEKASEDMEAREARKELEELEGLPLTTPLGAEIAAFPTLEGAVRHAMRSDREDRTCGHCGRMLADTTLVELMLHARRCRQLETPEEATAQGLVDRTVETEALAAMLGGGDDDDDGSGSRGVKGEGEGGGVAKQ